MIGSMHATKSKKGIPRNKSNGRHIGETLTKPPVRQVDGHIGITMTDHTLHSKVEKLNTGMTHTKMPT